MLTKKIKTGKVNVVEGLPKLFELVSQPRSLEEIGQCMKCLLEVLASPKTKKLSNYNLQVRTFTQILCQLIKAGELQTQIFALRFGIQSLKHITTSADFPSEMFKDLIHSLLTAKNWDATLADCLVSELCLNYRDLRVHMARFVDTGLDAYNKEDVASLTLTGKKRKRSGTKLNVNGEDLSVRVRDLLLRFPDVNDWPTSGEGEHQQIVPLGCFVESAEASLDMQSAVKKYKSAFISCWQRFLQLPMDADVTTSVLQHLPGHVLPHMGNPLGVANFYLTAFDRGSLSISVLALSGLFYLLTKQNLGDTERVGQQATKYFEKLYELLCPEVFALRHRVRFLRLLHLSLKSTMLPSSFIAAFVKKCARVAILVPSPPAALWLLVNMQALMMRHKSLCAGMLHKSMDDALTFGNHDGVDGSTDPFDYSAPLQVASKREQALTTSLWEIELLQEHYCPQVARMARLFTTPKFLLKTKVVDPEEFLDLSFDNLFQKEFNAGRKKHKKDNSTPPPPPVAFSCTSSYWDQLSDLAFLRPVN